MVIKDHSIKREDFIDFLKDVRDKCGDDPVYMFLDNSKVHHSLDVKPYWSELNITPCWNIAYRFEYNEAIEKFWSQVKTIFRPLLLNKMLAFPGPRKGSTPLRDAVFQSLTATPPTSIPKFVRRGLEQLAADAAAAKKEIG